MHESLIPGSKRMYGWKPSLPNHADPKFAPPPHLVTATLPDTVDLSSPILPAPFEPCLDQGQLGSCGPNTLTEDLSLIAERNEKIKINLPSRLFIYWCTRVLMKTTNQDSGVDNRTMMKALAQYGWCDDSLWPYHDDPNTFKVQPPQAAFTQAATRKIDAYYSVNQVLATMQSCIASGYPFIFGFTVYASFEGPGPASNGIIPMPGVTEQIAGGHDITACGYTNVNRPGVMPGNIWPARTFKMRNHWYDAPGQPWGDGGYAYIPYEYATNPELSSDFWMIKKSGLVVGPTPTPPSPTPTPTPTPPSPTPVHTIVVSGTGIGITVDGKLVV